MGIVEEEADESAYWMELLIDAELINAARVKDPLREAHELTAIAVASIKTSRRNSE
jgi:four helix bundle protein